MSIGKILRFSLLKTILYHFLKISRWMIYTMNSAITRLWETKTLGCTVWVVAKIVAVIDEEKKVVLDYRIDSQTKHFNSLCKFTEVVLIIFQSNIEAKQLFNMARKNKIDSCSSWKPEATFSPDSEIPRNVVESSRKSATSMQ